MFHDCIFISERPLAFHGTALCLTERHWQIEIVTDINSLVLPKMHIAPIEFVIRSATSGKARWKPR